MKRSGAQKEGSINVNSATLNFFLLPLSAIKEISFHRSLNNRSIKLLSSKREVDLNMTSEEDVVMTRKCVRRRGCCNMQIAILVARCHDFYNLF